MRLTFENFRHYNEKRSKEGFGHDAAVMYSAEWLALRLCGEAGELAQAVAKYEEAMQKKDFEEAINHFTNIREELGDVLPYLDRLATHYGFKIEECTATKFNQVSDRINCSVKIPV